MTCGKDGKSQRGPRLKQVEAGLGLSHRNLQELSKLGTPLAFFPCLLKFRLLTSEVTFSQPKRWLIPP
jgi:hypothetical protein